MWGFKPLHMAKDKCILCGAETPYDEETHIHSRNGYIEGAGQLCKNCSNGSNIVVPSSFIEHIPNDQELGETIRTIYFTKTIKHG